MNNKLLLMAVVGSLGLLLSGCNTARGLGADVEELGRVMQGKPKRTEVIETPGAVEQGQPVYVQPQSGVETYPYQGAVSYPATPAEPQVYPSQDPGLGEVVPAKTIKEM